MFISNVFLSFDYFGYNFLYFHHFRSVFRSWDLTEMCEKTISMDSYSNNGTFMDTKPFIFMILTRIY